MKLELKHLAGYLPYELKVSIRDSHDLIGVMEKVWQRDGTIHVNCDNGLGMFINDNFPTEFKPILRPLTDLTKEIEVNGLNYSFEGWVNETSCPEELEQYDRCIYKKLSDGSSIEMHYLTHRIFIKLLEWHFDIYGLIENGLAIDVNTL